MINFTAKKYKKGCYLSFIWNKKLIQLFLDLQIYLQIYIWKKSFLLSLNQKKKVHVSTPFSKLSQQLTPA